LPDPGRAARDFIAELQRRSLGDLARTPLMATMLCQLYTDRPGQPLPESRGEIYRAFTDLLYERQQDIGLHAQIHAALKECGDAALAAAENTLGRLRELIEYLEPSSTPATPRPRPTSWPLSRKPRDPNKSPTRSGAPSCR
jgi:hypothetical protein